MIIRPSSETGIIGLGQCHANTYPLLVGPELTVCYLLNHACTFRVHCTSLQLRSLLAYISKYQFSITPNMYGGVMGLTEVKKTVSIRQISNSQC